MKTEIFTCNAGNGQAWSADGLIKVIRYESGNAGGITPTIRIKSLMGNVYDLEMVPGRQVRLPEAVRGIVVQNISGAASLSGKLTLGAGDITDNSIVGEVSVIDGGKGRSLANFAFFGYANSNIVAGQYSHVQLWNLAASTKNLIVNAISTSSTTSNPFQLRHHNAQLATLSGMGASKRIGGPASAIAELRSTNSAAPIGTFMQFHALLLANTTHSLKLTEPIIVTPGSGLILGGGAVATDNFATFEFFEEPI